MHRIDHCTLGRESSPDKLKPARVRRNIFPGGLLVALRSKNDERAVVPARFKSGVAPSTLYASCGSGGRPARRKNARRPGKVELFASPVETRALDQEQNAASYGRRDARRYKTAGPSPL